MHLHYIFPFLIFKNIIDRSIRDGVSTITIFLWKFYLFVYIVTVNIREEVIEWDKQVKQVGESLMELLGQGLGLSPNKFKEMGCIKRRLMVGQYYPYCPEPNKTVGIAAHTDLETLTILLQDQKGGLQVNCHGKWVDVKPLHGALVISIGDTLQVII